MSTAGLAGIEKRWQSLFESDKIKVIICRKDVFLMPESGGLIRIEDYERYIGKKAVRARQKK